MYVDVVFVCVDVVVHMDAVVMYRMICTLLYFK